MACMFPSKNGDVQLADFMESEFSGGQVVIYKFDVAIKVFNYFVSTSVKDYT